MVPAFRVFIQIRHWRIGTGCNSAPKKQRHMTGNISRQSGNQEGMEPRDASPQRRIKIISTRNLLNT